MRVIYADPGLRDNLGHHANSCRTIRAEIQNRGLDVVVLSHDTIIPDLKAEPGAPPLFRAYMYWQSDGDPVAGWLNCFDSSMRATVDDLKRLSGVSADDVVYLNSTRPPQFLALITWVRLIPRAGG